MPWLMSGYYINLDHVPSVLSQKEYED